MGDRREEIFLSALSNSAHHDFTSGVVQALLVSSHNFAYFMNV